MKWFCPTSRQRTLPAGAQYGCSWLPMCNDQPALCLCRACGATGWGTSCDAWASGKRLQRYTWSAACHASLCSGQQLLALCFFTPSFLLPACHVFRPVVYNSGARGAGHQSDQRKHLGGAAGTGGGPRCDRHAARRRPRLAGGRAAPLRACSGRSVASLQKNRALVPSCAQDWVAVEELHAVASGAGHQGAGHYVLYWELCPPAFARLTGEQTGARRVCALVGAAQAATGRA